MDLESAPVAQPEPTLGGGAVGLGIGTLFTLFVVPAFYHLLARRSGSPEAVAREIERLSTHRAESR